MRTMKTYVLTVSRYFPKTHKRAGEPTHFVEKLLVGQYDKNKDFYLQDTQADFDREIFFECRNPKFHTIRTNVELWQKRISEIQKGNAILSIRYWSGKPYNSKQVEICQLDKNSGIGIELLDLSVFKELGMCFINYNELTFSGAKNVNLKELAKNDGLSLEDFEEWFKKYDFSKPLAIIHFTAFRYFS